MDKRGLWALLGFEDFCFDKSFFCWVSVFRLELPGYLLLELLEDLELEEQQGGEYQLVHPCHRLQQD